MIRRPNTNNPGILSSAVKSIAAYAASKAIKGAIDHPVKAVNAVKRVVKGARALAKRNPGTKTMSTPTGGGSSSVPVAYSNNHKPFISYKTVGNSVTVRGCEVVIPTVGNGNTNLNHVIPHNPAYWLGTRLQVIAKTYQFFRINRLTFHYIPRVPTTTAGTIAIGTLATELPMGAVDTVVLANSLGGIIAPVWTSVDSTPDLRMTPLRMYQTYSPENLMDWAFYTAIAIQDITTAIGSLMVSYEVTLSQPLWDGRTFTTYSLHSTQFILYGDKDLEKGWWKVANAATPFASVEDEDEIATVIHVGSSCAAHGLIAPNLNVLSTLSITVGLVDTAGAGYRSVQITYGGHEVENHVASGASNYIAVMLWGSYLKNTSTIYAENSQSTIVYPTHIPKLLAEASEEELQFLTHALAEHRWAPPAPTTTSTPFPEPPWPKKDCVRPMSAK